MHCETKNFVGIPLLCYLLYCSGLEPNPQYLRGLLTHRVVNEMIVKESSKPQFVH